MEEKVKRNWSGDALFLDRVELLALEGGLETERTSPESIVLIFPGGIEYQSVEAEIMDRASEPFHQSVFVLRAESIKPSERILPDAHPEGSTGSARKTVERLQLEVDRKLKVYVWESRGPGYAEIRIIAATSIEEAQAILRQNEGTSLSRVYADMEPDRIIDIPGMVYEEDREWGVD